MDIRCPNGTHINKNTGVCEKKTIKIKRKRCPNGTRRNKKTGNCEKKTTKTNEISIKKSSNGTRQNKKKKTGNRNDNNNIHREQTKVPGNIVLPNIMTRDRYNSIKDKYGHMSSWAIWAKQNGKSKSGMDDISFFYNPSQTLLNTLNPNIILVGLNISEKIDRVFGNFHPTSSNAQDYKTRYAVKDTMFWGAYMTDIIKSFEEKISGNLMKYLNKNKEFEKENIESFKQELIDIGSTNPILIALGNDSYKILKRHFPKHEIYKITHYSAYITKEKLRLEFEKLENKLRTNASKV